MIDTPEYERHEPVGDEDDSITIKLTNEGIIVDAIEADGVCLSSEVAGTWALTYDELWEFVTNRRGK